MKMYNLVVTLLCFYALSTNTLVKSQNWLIDELLPPDYNQSETPIHNPNDYLPVRASIMLYQFDVPFEQNAIEANLLLCLEWQDYRIRSLSSVSGQESNITRQMNYINVKFTQLGRFWQPKVDFRNAESVSVVESIRQVRYLQVRPEEKLLKSCSRLSVTFTCYMNLSTLPFDQQYCFFELQTVQNSIQHLQLEMQSMESIVRGQRMFRVLETFKGGCFPLSDGETVHESENQPCVFGAIRLVRRVSYFVVRYYAPTFLTVCMSTLEFFIPTNGWPARIILTATVLLGLIRISVNAYNTIPVRDVVSLIWWIWGLHLIIYCCLCEFPLALAWYEFILEKKKAKATNTQSPDGIYFGRKGWYKACGVRIEAFLKVIYGPTDHYRDPINRNKVDYVARLVGPSVIGIYTLTYIVTTIPAWAPRYRWGSSQPLD